MNNQTKERINAYLGTVNSSSVARQLKDSNTNGIFDINTLPLSGGNLFGVNEYIQAYQNNDAFT